MNLQYQKLFDPSALAPVPPTPALLGQVADRSSGWVYDYTDEIVLAVNVALATNRPLLVRGASGSGKSSLARSVAVRMGCALVECVLTSRSEADALQWEIDLLRRLQDAQAKALADDWRRYVSPGPLWWAFDARSAVEHLAAGGAGAVPSGWDVAAPPGRTVLLLDEIDKAEPDVPNNLLRQLGDLSFQVPHIDLRVTAAQPPVVFITTNEERDLPPAFLRRCVELTMPSFDRDRLVRIGSAHHPALSPLLVAEVADVVLEVASRDGPSAAEYLDVLRACDALGVGPRHAAFGEIRRIVLRQRGRA